jgi:hypothetical protein
MKLRNDTGCLTKIKLHKYYNFEISFVIQLIYNLKIDINMT